MYAPNGSSHPSFGSDEWNEMAALRRGQPNGAHIRDEPGDDEVLVSAMSEDSVESRMERAWDRLKARDVPPDRPNLLTKLLDPGFLLTVIIALGSVLVTGVGLVMQYQKDQAAIYSAITKIQGDSSDQITKALAEISSVQADVKYNRDQMVANQQAAEARALRYAPVIEAEQRAQDVTNTRIENIVKAIGDLRDSVQDVVKIVSQDHTDIQVLKVQIEGEGKTRTPHEK